MFSFKRLENFQQNGKKDVIKRMKLWIVIMDSKIMDGKIMDSNLQLLILQQITSLILYIKVFDNSKDNLFKIHYF